MFVKLSYIMVRKRRQCRWVSSKHLIWLRVATAGRAAGRGGEQQARGPLLLSPHYLALPICLFPSCASAFHLCLLKFFLIRYPSHLMMRRKMTVTELKEYQKGERPELLVWFLFIFSFFCLFFFLFCKIWPSEVWKICIYLEL